jgi:hypothetical protein
MSYVGQIVSTPYGCGKVIENRINDLVIHPINWVMAAGQKPIFYIKKSDATPLFNAGDLVSTQYGKGKIESIREEDGVHIVTLDNWLLVNGSPTLYLQGEVLTKRSVDSSTEKIFCAGKKVTTPYGNGIVSEIRSDGTVVMCPDNWLLANGKPPVFYMHESSVTVLSSSNSAVSGVDDKKAPSQSVAIKVNKSIEMRDKGTALFKNNELEAACSMFQQALTILNVRET